MMSGVPCLRPIDVVAEGLVQEPSDILDVDVWTFVSSVLRSRSVLALGNPLLVLQHGPLGAD